MDELQQEPGVMEKIVAALRGAGQAFAGGGPDIISDSQAYNAYRAAVMENGGTPLSREEWVAAGRPSM